MRLPAKICTWYQLLMSDGSKLDLAHQTHIGLFDARRHLQKHGIALSATTISKSYTAQAYRIKNMLEENLSAWANKKIDAYGRDNISEICLMIQRTR